MVPVHLPPLKQRISIPLLLGVVLATPPAPRVGPGITGARPATCGSYGLGRAPVQAV